MRREVDEVAEAGHAHADAHAREASPAQRVDVLLCTKCGAALALGDGDTTTCTHCATEVVVPEPHRRLRALREKDAALRARGEAMFDRLDSPPSMAVGVLAMTLDLNMLAFLMVYGIPVGLASILLALAATSRLAVRLHVPEDRVPFAVTMLFLALILLVLVFVPRVLGVYANRRASGRMMLVDSLAAKLPTTPGGPAKCRECGAPLEIREDARVCDCVYCGAQNAVRIRTKLLARTGEAVAALGKTVEDALRIDDGERAPTRAKLWSELGRYALRTFSLVGLFTLAGSMDDEVDALGSRHTSIVGAGAIVALVFLVFFFIYRSISGKADNDGPQRRAGNPAPEWVRFVGPAVFLVLIYLLWSHHG